MDKVKFSPIHRDRLFFDQFEYSLCCRMPESAALRESTVDAVMQNIRWRNESRRRWGGRGSSEVTVAQMDDIIDMWHRLRQHQDNIKFTTSFNTLYVYGNDPDMLKDIAVASYTGGYYGQQALVTKPRDIVIKENPEFKLRSYFKDRRLEKHDQERLLNFFLTRTDTYGFTKNFRMNLERTSWCWVQRHHWIEHNDEKDLTLLSLFMPGLIRKTVPVQAK